MSSPSAAPLDHPRAEDRSEAFQQWADEVRAATTDRPLGVGGARPVPAGRTAVVRLPLDPALRAAVGRTAREHAVTPLTVGLAALAVTLTRRTGTDRAVAGALRVPVVLAVRDDLTRAELLAGTDLALERSLSLWTDGTDAQIPDHAVEFRHGAAPTTLSGAREIGIALCDGDPAEGVAHLVALYNADRYTEDSVSALLGQLRTVLRTLTGEEPVTAGALPLLDEAEQQALLGLGTGDPLPEDGREPVHAQVAALAAADPGRIALVCGDEQVTRGELDAWAGRIAARLASAGVGPGDRVGILADRSTAMVAAVLGAVRTGAAYVPVDPANPDERIAAVLTDARVSAVVVTGALGQPVAPLGVGVVTADESAVRGESEALSAAGSRDEANIDEPAVRRDGKFLPGALTGLRDAAVVPAAGGRAVAPDAGEPGQRSTPIGPGDAAYLIYTSGSTGTPKGVVVEHAQLAASTRARREVYPGEPVFLLLSPLAFDSSVAGLWGTLTAGGRLVVAGPDEFRDPDALLKLVERHAVTHLLCVPSLYDTLLAAGERLGLSRLASLTTVITAGEALPEALLRRHAEALGSAAVLVNEYGPTEATVWASYRRFDTAGPVDIGGPVPGTRLYVLDEAGRLVPPGITGELHIGGAGVSRGYFGRPDATSRVFTADPFAGEDARMYRTGDLVRWSGAGTLEFLGRRDNQVKIRGHRVELGAVESALRACPGIREAVVVPDSAGTRLTAFVVTAAPDELPAVRERLVRTLPEAAVPSTLHALDAFPVTVNGKADRAALAALVEQEAQSVAPAMPAPSSGDPLGQVSAAWAEVLQVSSVPGDVNFFDLGGHSLLIIRLQDALGRHTGVRPSVVDLFRCSTVNAQAELVRAGAAAGPGTAAPANDRAERARRERVARARQRRVQQGAAR
ncbi:non-ribosomal peptide synthetase [Streptomyces spiramyceticus]|uniref:non-ribosomal peptide synthetase n=1 Tax=Streptomyces spiramyceticus TaxID=299717 RepID=UPI00237A1A09|nr:amino acid adenylation domain-containing protein [Streptomyces spiramyceticus]